MAPIWARWDVPVIVNIAGDSVEEFGEMAAMLDGIPGIAAIELNISRPNVDIGGIEIGQNVEARRAQRAPPSSHGPARDCEAHSERYRPCGARRGLRAEGAAAIVRLNTVLGLAIDTSRRAILPRARGGLSGPAIKLSRCASSTTLHAR